MRSEVAVLEVTDSYIKVNTDGFEENNNAQLWYFVAGTEPSQVKILNVSSGSTKLMSVASGNFSEADSKVTMIDADDSTVVNSEWVISNTNSASGWYNIQAASNTGMYFSNHGGDSKYMGFYNSETDTDKGSNFQFVHKTTSSTMISDITEVSETNDVIYDLQGRRVYRPSKGVYIINGTKRLR